ncbi:YcxB family protein [Mariniluteicoccus flavus]
MIASDGRLVFDIAPRPDRVFGATMRWVVHPVRGIVCGLVGLAALFVLAVEVLLGVGPGVIPLVMLAGSVLLYAVWVLRARAEAAKVGESRLVLDERGIAEHGARGDRALAWGRFERWLENDHEFLVLSRVDKRRGVTLLPKDSVPGDEEEAVRVLLDTHIDPDAESLDDAFVEEEWDEDWDGEEAQP